MAEYPVPNRIVVGSSPIDRSMDDANICKHCSLVGQLDELRNPTHPNWDKTLSPTERFGKIRRLYIEYEKNPEHDSTCFYLKVREIGLG